MNTLSGINTAIVSLNSIDFLRIIFYGSKSFNKKTDCKVLTATIKFINDAKRFKKSLS